MVRQLSRLKLGLRRYAVFFHVLLINPLVPSTDARSNCLEDPRLICQREEGILEASEDLRIFPSSTASASKNSIDSTTITTVNQELKLDGASNGGGLQTSLSISTCSASVFGLPSQLNDIYNNPINSILVAYSIIALVPMPVPTYLHVQVTESLTGIVVAKQKVILAPMEVNATIDVHLIKQKMSLLLGLLDGGLKHVKTRVSIEVPPSAERQIGETSQRLNKLDLPCRVLLTTQDSVDIRKTDNSSVGGETDDNLAGSDYAIVVIICVIAIFVGVIFSWMMLLFCCSSERGERFRIVEESHNADHSMRTHGQFGNRLWKNIEGNNRWSRLTSRLLSARLSDASGSIQELPREIEKKVSSNSFSPQGKATFVFFGDFDEHTEDARTTTQA